MLEGEGGAATFVRGYGRGLTTFVKGRGIYTNNNNMSPVVAKIEIKVQFW